MKPDVGNAQDWAIGDISISALLLPMVGDPLLVPLTAVAEVVAGHATVRNAADPAWLHGWIDWRQHSIPVLSFPAVTGAAREALDPGSVIAIFNGVGAAASRGFFALALAGFPRSIKLSAASGLTTTRGYRYRPGELLAGALAADPMRVPDFDHLEQLSMSIPPPVLVR